MSDYSYSITKSGTWTAVRGARNFVKHFIIDTIKLKNSFTWILETKINSNRSIFSLQIQVSYFFVHLGCSIVNLLSIIEICFYQRSVISYQGWVPG